MTRSVFSSTICTRPFIDRGMRVLNLTRSPQKNHLATQVEQHSVELPTIDSTVHAGHRSLLDHVTASEPDSLPSPKSRACVVAELSSGVEARPGSLGPS